MGTRGLTVMLMAFTIFMAMIFVLPVRIAASTPPEHGLSGFPGGQELPSGSKAGKGGRIDCDLSKRAFFKKYDIHSAACGEEGARVMPFASGVKVMVHNFTAYRLEMIDWHNWIISYPLEKGRTPNLNLSSYREKDEEKLRSEPPIKTFVLFYSDKEKPDDQYMVWQFRDETGERSAFKLVLIADQINERYKNVASGFLEMAKMGCSAIKGDIIGIVKSAVNAAIFASEGDETDDNSRYYARIFPKSEQRANSIGSFCDSNTYFAVDDQYRFYGSIVTAHTNYRPDMLLVYLYDRYGYAYYRMSYLLLNWTHGISTPEERKRLKDFMETQTFSDQLNSFNGNKMIQLNKILFQEDKKFDTWGHYGVRDVLDLFDDVTPEGKV